MQTTETFILQDTDTVSNEKKIQMAKFRIISNFKNQVSINNLMIFTQENYVQNKTQIKIFIKNCRNIIVTDNFLLIDI